eukprot:109119_1
MSFVKYIESNHEMDDIEDIVDEYQYKGKCGLIECDDGTITVDKCICTDLFNCVVEPIINMVGEVLRRREMAGCKDILLCGGFSESKYLQSMLRMQYHDSYMFHTMPRPILAVVEGAARMGLQPDTISRWFAPETIGLQITRDYDAKIDDESMKRKYEDVIDCGFGTLIEKGQKIDANKCVIKWFKPWNSKQTEIKI